MVGPRKAESQMAEEIKAKKIWPKKSFFSIWPTIQMAESRSSGPPLARAHFSPLDLDSANFTV
jgi:hypothetical protein